MNNLYYMIWADAIQRIRKHHPHKKNWKITIFLYITWMHALNFWIILLWLKYFDVFVMPDYDVDVFPGDLLDNFLSFSIRFASPFVVLNYFLIFYKGRYELINQKHKEFAFSYAAVYSFAMLILALISAFAYGILTSE